MPEQTHKIILEVNENGNIELDEVPSSYSLEDIEDFLNKQYGYFRVWLNYDVTLNYKKI